MKLNHTLEELKAMRTRATPGGESQSIIDDAIALHEIVAKLPRTKDDVVFRGAMVVYVHPDALKDRCWLIYKRENPKDAFDGSFSTPRPANVISTPAPIDGGDYVDLATVPDREGGPVRLRVPMRFCFSTRAATEAASK